MTKWNEIKFKRWTSMKQNQTICKRNYINLNIMEWSRLKENKKHWKEMKKVLKNKTSALK